MRIKLSSVRFRHRTHVQVFVECVLCVKVKSKPIIWYMTVWRRRHPHLNQIERRRRRKTSRRQPAELYRKSPLTIQTNNQTLTHTHTSHTYTHTLHARTRRKLIHSIHYVRRRGNFLARTHATKFTQHAGPAGLCSDFPNPILKCAVYQMRSVIAFTLTHTPLYCIIYQHRSSFFFLTCAGARERRPNVKRRSAPPKYKKKTRT